MLKTFGLIIFGLIVLAVIAAAASKKGKAAADAKSDGYRYKNKALLTANEREIYWKLIDALPGYVVLAQVALSSCIDTKGGAFNTIRAKSLDFVICNGSLDVLAGIEIDDKSHATAAAQKRDATKNRAMEVAGIKLIRWPAMPLPSVEEIRKIFPPVPIAVAEKSTIEITQEKKIKILEQQLFNMARNMARKPDQTPQGGKTAGT